MESATLTRPQPGPARLGRLTAVPPSVWAKVGFGTLALAALLGFLVYPTYPTYDSYYALLWGREALHLQLPSFAVYRAPTEHPLAIAFGALLSLAGESAERLMVGATIASYLALVAGVYRLARRAFNPLVAAIAVFLLLTRFQFAFLAARGYLDVPYLAIMVWAAAMEVQRPRRGTPVFLALAAAGLLRPETWIVIGLYFLWCSWSAPWERRLRYAALAALAPAVWAGVDLAVTGDPLFSLHSTSGLTGALGRNKGVATIPGAMVSYLARLDKVPVLGGAGVGVALSLWLCPRRAVLPLVLAASGLGTFALVGFAGLSIIDRYLLVSSLMIIIFAAVGLGGWSLLLPGSWLRRLWAVAALCLVAYGIAYTAKTLSPANITTELGFRGDSHHALVQLLGRPAFRRVLTCGPISVPDHKLIPEIRWILDRGPTSVVARSDARTRAQHGELRLQRRLEHSVGIYPTGTAVFREAIVDPGDDPLNQVPPRGFERVTTTQYYAAYARC